MTTLPIGAQPKLPDARGPISAAVIELLAQCTPHTHLEPVEARLHDSDPLGLDLQLALYVCYELHYRGFTGVDDSWEWDPALLGLRAAVEQRFLDAVREEVGGIEADASAESEMAALATEPAHPEGLSYVLRDNGTWEQMREYFVHGSLYHLKEADPHAWTIPRLTGQAKASFVAIEFDEYGGGRGQWLHQQLFADLLEAAGLDPGYLGYLDCVPGETLAVVNLMSLFGLHRRWRAAAIGHFAATEITSPPGSRRLVEALERVLSGTRYGAHRVTVGEDEQAGGVRRHDDHDHGPSRYRCLAGAIAVVMVPVAVGRDLLGQNRFRTV